MPVLSKRDLSFLNGHEVCRLATATKKGVPHVVPVIYAMDGSDVIIVVDYGTRKLKNIRENGEVALVVDDYGPNRGVTIQGKCEVLERGAEYRRLLKLLFERFEYYRRNPWKEGESPILKVHARSAASW